MGWARKAKQCDYMYLNRHKCHRSFGDSLQRHHYFANLRFVRASSVNRWLADTCGRMLLTFVCRLGVAPQTREHDYEGNLQTVVFQSRTSAQTIRCRLILLYGYGSL